SNLLNYQPTGQLPGSGEQGLGGMAIDPSNGDLIVAMLYSSNPSDANAAHYGKIVRLHSNDGGVTMSSQKTLLSMPNESTGQAHNLSDVSIGPDGKLYVHNGDGFSGDAQKLNKFRGKI